VFCDARHIKSPFTLKGKRQMAYERRFLKLLRSKCDFKPDLQSDPDDVIALLLSRFIDPDIPQEAYIALGLAYVEGFEEVVESALSCCYTGSLSSLLIQRHDIVQGLDEYLEYHSRLDFQKFQSVLRDAWFEAAYRAQRFVQNYLVRLETLFTTPAISNPHLGLTGPGAQRFAVFGCFVANTVGQDLVKAYTEQDALTIVARRIGYDSSQDMLSTFQKHTKTLVQATVLRIEPGSEEFRRLQLQIDGKHSKLSLARRVERGQLELGALSAFAHFSQNGKSPSSVRYADSPTQPEVEALSAA
jgi:hypothetical protein